MEINNDIVNSFKAKDSLSPEIFEVSGDNFILKPDVRQKLIRIGINFVESLNLDSVEIEDIIIIGSLVNYNWSKYSDLDLHIVLDYSNLSDNEQINQEFLKTKKKQFNDKYHITINGFEVELGTQHTDEELNSLGCYSVLYNKWIQEPVKENYKIDKHVLLKKYRKFVDAFNELKSEHNLKQRLDKINKLKDIISRYRQSGLDSGGEFSIENMIFKYLRRVGYMSNLDRLKILTTNRLSSLK